MAKPGSWALETQSGWQLRSWNTQVRVRGLHGCQRLNLGLLGDLEGIIDLDAQISHRALKPIASWQ